MDEIGTTKNPDGDEPVSEELFHIAASVANAKATGRYVVAVLREEGGQVKLDLTAHNWRNDDFPIALKMLRDEFARIIKDPSCRVEP